VISRCAIYRGFAGAVSDSAVSVLDAASVLVVAMAIAVAVAVADANDEAVVAAAAVVRSLSVRILVNGLFLPKRPDSSSPNGSR